MSILLRIAFCQSIKGNVCPRVEMVLCHLILQPLTERFEGIWIDHMTCKGLTHLLSGPLQKKMPNADLA